MKMTIAVLALGFLLTNPMLTQAQVQSGKIVTVDLDRTFKEYYKTPIASQKLKEEAEQFNKEHDEMLGQYRKQVDELNKLREEQDKTEYTEEIRNQKKKAFQDKLVDTQKSQRDIEEYRNSHRQILDQKQQRMRTSIIKEISDVITKEARDAGYAFVFDKSGNTLNGVPGLVYSQDSIEITDEIVKILNKNKPADLPKVEEKKSDKPADKKSDKPADKK